MKDMIDAVIEGLGMKSFGPIFTNQIKKNQVTV